MTADCEVCHRIKRMTPDNPYLVAELETGFAVLADNQHIPGYTIFVCKTCVPELHDLPAGVRTRFLDEMALVAEAVFRAFAPRKLNYELLGNSVPHLHWHLIPRYADDPNPQWPVWNSAAFLSAPRRTEIAPAELAELRDRVRRALADVRARPAGTKA
jgi:diadenosine tetraphosphate (Ap4A) HIT family hydrolase